MKNFFKQLFLLSIVPFFVFVFNYTIDYRSEGSNFIKNFVHDLNINDSLNVYINFPERMVVKERILSQNISSNVVLGSSRSMLIGKPTGLNVSNFGVSGAVLKDFKYIYSYIKESNSQLSTIYIEISPWLLNTNTKESRYKKFIPPSLTEKIKTLFSVRYFFDNIKLNKYDYEVNAEDYVWYKDGTIKYNKDYVEYDINKIKEFNTDEVYLLDGFNDIKNLNILEFSFFIDEILLDGIKIILVKHPYPPLISDDIISKYPNILKSEILIDSLALLKNIKVLGSFDSKNNKLENTDFYDGLHLNPNGIKKLLDID